MRSAAGHPELEGQSTGINDKLYQLEDVLIQYAAVFRMEYHAKATKLDDKLYNLAGHVLRGDARPTVAQQELFVEHKKTFQDVLDGLNGLKRVELAAYRQLTE